MAESPSTPIRPSGDVTGKMAGEYRLGRKLGEGGFGTVYEAEHPLLKRRAAVKVLHRVGDKDSEGVLRFISEAQAVNQIRNRHIIDVFSFGQLSDGRHFYVMDLLEGEPLDRWLSRTGKVDVATALQLLQPIAEALDLAHAAGIVHRDIKPQNIFLSWDGSGDTVPKLLDFGMAKLLGDSSVHTVSGTPIGTPLYMSPEQARGEKVDHRSDVYALGVLCHELLTGELLFTGDTTIAVLMAHIIQQPKRVSEVNLDLPAELDAPILRMLDKDPTARPPSAGQALLAVRSAAEQAGIATPTGLARLPRPEPLFSVDSAREAVSTLSAGNAATVAHPPAVSAISAKEKRASLLPVGVTFLAVGALVSLIYFFSASSSNNGADSAQPTLSVAAASAPVPNFELVPAVSSPSASSEPRLAPPPAARSAELNNSEAKKLKKRANTDPKPAIPTDLESPF